MSIHVIHAFLSWALTRYLGALAESQPSFMRLTWAKETEEPDLGQLHMGASQLNDDTGLWLWREGKKSPPIPSKFPMGGASTALGHHSSFVSQVSSLAHFHRPSSLLLHSPHTGTRAVLSPPAAHRTAWAMFSQPVDLSPPTPAVVMSLPSCRPESGSFEQMKYLRYGLVIVLPLQEVLAYLKACFYMCFADFVFNFYFLL